LDGAEISAQDLSGGELADANHENQYQIFHCEVLLCKFHRPDTSSGTEVKYPLRFLDRGEVKLSPKKKAINVVT
jgi:hypothetical protein